MPIEYELDDVLFEDDFAGVDNWHHEGVGEVAAAPDGGMRLHCFGSRQGGAGCMAFFRDDIPDGVACEYDLVVRSHGGLVINYLAIRGINGEDLIADIDKLPPRKGVMKNYFALKWGLQSYHISISRFGDDGAHSGTSNCRRNPGSRMVGHGLDPVQEVGRKYHIRLVKDRGHIQLYVDGRFSYACIDRDTEHGPAPDYGKFGFRLIGSDVMADISDFRVSKVVPNRTAWMDYSDMQ